MKFEVELGGEQIDKNNSIFVDPGSLGIPQRLEWDRVRSRGTYSFGIPQNVKIWLEQQLSPEVLGTQTVWLDLVKPYGYLGMVPWEVLLSEVVRNPIVRLPDWVTDPPQKATPPFDIALLAFAPDKAADSGMVAAIDRAARHLVNIPNAPMRLEVICEKRIWKLLNQLPISKHPAVNLRSIAKPRSKRKLSARPHQKKKQLTLTDEVLSASTRNTNTWLNMARQVCGERSFDIVHVLAHARHSFERGALLAPRSRYAIDSELINVSEFSLFQAQIGAWAAVVTAPLENFSDMASRQFADSLAQARPGPVVFHDEEGDREFSVCQCIYQFLLSDKPSVPPSSPAIFLYADPFRVLQMAAPEASFRTLSEEFAAPVIDEYPEISTLFEGADNVPSWVAASERFVDLYKGRIRQLQARASGDVDHKQAEEMRTALKNLQTAVVHSAHLSAKKDRG